MPSYFPILQLAFWAHYYLFDSIFIFIYIFFFLLEQIEQQASRRHILLECRLVKLVDEDSLALSRFLGLDHVCPSHLLCLFGHSFYFTCIYSLLQSSTKLTISRPVPSSNFHKSVCSLVLPWSIGLCRYYWACPRGKRKKKKRLRWLTVDRRSWGNNNHSTQGPAPAHVSAPASCLAPKP